MQYSGLGGLTLATASLHGAGAFLGVVSPQNAPEKRLLGQSHSMELLLAAGTGEQRPGAGRRVAGEAAASHLQLQEQRGTVPSAAAGPGAGRGKSSVSLGLRSWRGCRPVPEERFASQGETSFAPIAFVLSCAGLHHEGFTKKIFPCYQPLFGPVGKKKDRNEVPSGGFQDLHLLVMRQKAAAQGERAASPRSCLRAGLPAARTEQGGSLHTPMSHPQPPNSAEICRFWARSQEKARAVSEEAAQH